MQFGPALRYVSEIAKPQACLYLAPQVALVPFVLSVFVSSRGSLLS